MLHSQRRTGTRQVQVNGVVKGVTSHGQVDESAVRARDIAACYAAVALPAGQQSVPAEPQLMMHGLLLLHF